MQEKVHEIVESYLTENRITRGSFISTATVIDIIGYVFETIPMNYSKAEILVLEELKKRKINF